MFGLLRFFCAVASAAASMQIYEMCPGTSFYIPPSSEYDPKMSDLYFTPGLSGHRGTVMILNKTKPVDDHYKYQDETLFISELQERDTGIFSWSNNQKFNTVLKLVIKDCSVPHVVVFGKPLELDIPYEAATLEFSPSSSPDTKKVLLPPSSSTVSKGSRHGNTWSLQSTSKADSGFYTFRKQSGVEVSKINVIVTADMQFYNIDEEEPTKVFEIYLPTSKVFVTLSVTTPSGTKYRAIDRGYVTDEGRIHFGDRIRMLGREDGSVMTVRELLRTDAGRYEFCDPDDHNVLAVWILSTNPSPSYYVYLYALIPVVLLILLCVCVKMCCCKKPKSAPSAQATAASAQETAASDNTPYSPVEMNALEPASTTVPQHPADMGRADPPPSGPSASLASSALDFPSDDQPRFQLREFGSGAGDFLTFPLSMDAGAANGDSSVYTSSKLN